MTYRERRERRAERLREWAEKRQTTANSTLKADSDRYRGDHAFNFQPGHIPERARVIARTDRAFESLRKAESMDSRANNIESQLRGAIYSDDEDAIPALRERIASLEAERERVKAYNKSARAGTPDPTLLDAEQRASLASAQRWMPTKNATMPSYHLANLNGNISRQRERLAMLERKATQ